MHINLQTLIAYITIYFILLVIIFLFLSLFERKKIKKSLKKFFKISILIPAHNEEKNIIQTLNAIKKVDYPKEKIEVIVVDDGSTDKTYELVKNFGKNVKIFRKKHGGKASALNFGIKKCSGDLILTLDADCIIEKNLFKKMIKYFDEETVAVVPTLKVLKKEKFLEKMQQIEYTLTNFTRKILWFVSAMHLAPGAPLYKASFLKKNRFDKGNLTEDLEMGLKIISKGHKIAHATNAFVYTKVPNTLKSLMRQRIRWTYGLLHNFKRYGFLFGLKYGDLSLFVLPTILISVAIGCFIFLYSVGLLLYHFSKTIYLSSYVGFDFALNFQAGRIAEVFFNEMLYFSIVLLCLGLVFYCLAIKELKEKFGIHWFFYILTYGWLLYFFNLIALILFISRKKPKW